MDLEYFNNLENETIARCAEKYRELIIAQELGATIDCFSINKKIIDRWSILALGKIKTNAWIRSNDNGDTWVTLKFERKAFCVKRKQSWEFLRVGFATEEEAKKHLDNMLKERKPDEMGKN